MSQKIDEGDVKQIYDMVFSHIQEDRAKICAAYDDLRNNISGSLAAYATGGDTLAKYGDLLIKQNAQLVDLLKIAQKDSPAAGELTPEDYESISKEIDGKEK